MKVACRRVDEERVFGDVAVHPCALDASLIHRHQITGEDVVIFEHRRIHIKLAQVASHNSYSRIARDDVVDEFRSQQRQRRKDAGTPLSAVLRYGVIQNEPAAHSQINPSAPNSGIIADQILHNRNPGTGVGRAPSCRFRLP